MRTLMIVALIAGTGLGGMPFASAQTASGASASRVAPTPVSRRATTRPDLATRMTAPADLAAGVPMTAAVRAAALAATPSPLAAQLTPAAATTAAQPPSATPVRRGMLTPAATRAAAAYRLDPAAVRNGAVTAVVDGRAEPVSADNLVGKAAQHPVFVTRTGSATTKVALPAALQAALPTGAKAAAVQLSYALSTPSGPQGKPIHLVALIANNTGLVLDVAHAGYRGGFLVALSNTDDPTDRRVLDVPITVAITATGASDVQPAPLDIAQVGGWHQVTVTVPKYPGATYRVGVSADPQDRGDAIDLPVSSPAVQIIAANPEITGWGIGQTAITVRASGLVAPAGYVITLHNAHGALDPTYVTLDAQGVATTTLRSDSAASTVVRVGDAGMTSDPATVVFTPPWLFLTAAILGGLLGAFIRGKGRRHRWHALAIGVGSAVLMTLAYAVGIDWVSRLLGAPRLATSGEAVVFVLGAIAALVGVGALLPRKA